MSFRAKSPARKRERSPSRSPRGTNDKNAFRHSQTSPRMTQHYGGSHENSASDPGTMNTIPVQAFQGYRCREDTGARSSSNINPVATKPLSTPSSAHPSMSANAPISAPNDATQNSASVASSRPELWAKLTEQLMEKGLITVGPTGSAAIAPARPPTLLAGPIYMNSMMGTQAPIQPNWSNQPMSWMGPTNTVAMPIYRPSVEMSLQRVGAGYTASQMSFIPGPPPDRITYSPPRGLHDSPSYSPPHSNHRDLTVFPSNAMLPVNPPQSLEVNSFQYSGSPSPWFSQGASARPANADGMPLSQGSLIYNPNIGGGTASVPTNETPQQRYYRINAVPPRALTANPQQVMTPLENGGFGFCAPRLSVGNQWTEPFGNVPPPPPSNGYMPSRLQGTQGAAVTPLASTGQVIQSVLLQNPAGDSFVPSNPSRQTAEPFVVAPPPPPPGVPPRPHSPNRDNSSSIVSHTLPPLPPLPPYFPVPAIPAVIPPISDPTTPSVAVAPVILWEDSDASGDHDADSMKRQNQLDAPANTRSKSHKVHRTMTPEDRQRLGEYIARFVVIELTPYLKRNWILSKDEFKELAKKLTNDIAAVEHIKNIENERTLPKIKNFVSKHMKRLHAKKMGAITQTATQ